MTSPRPGSPRLQQALQKVLRLRAEPEVQGLGEALMEEQEFRLRQHKFPSMLEYKSPTTLETPEIATILVERPAAENLRPFARFPQGPPEGVDLLELPKPQTGDKK